MPRKTTSPSGVEQLARWLGPRSTLVLLLVTAVVVGVRIAYLMSLHRSPFFSNPILDSRIYDAWGLSVASGNWLGQDAFFMGPLYPYFLGAVYGVLGHNMLAAVAIQLLLGSVSCVLVFLVAKRAANILVGLTAVLMLSFYGPLLFFEGLLLPEFLGILTSLAWLYVLIRRGRDSGPKTFLLAGIMMGLSALTRASALVFVPAVILWIALTRGLMTRRVAALSGALVLGVCIVIAPVTLRNYVVANDLVFITSNGGLNLYVGNNERADGMYHTVEGLHMVGADPASDMTGRNHAERALSRKLRASEVSAYWRGESLKFVRQNPGRFASLFLRKVILFWNSYEVPQVEDYYIWKDSSPPPVPLLPFAFLVPLGVVGMAMTARRGERFLLLNMFVLFYMVSICVFFVTARYRVQVIPVVSIFSACALWRLIEHLNRRAYARVAIVLAVLLVLLAATGRPMLGALGITPQTQTWRWHLYRGTKLLSDPRTLDAAIQELTMAAEKNPGNPETFNNLGSAYEKKGMLDRATAAFQRAVAVDSTCVEARYNLAFLHQRQEDYGYAIKLYGKVLELQPYLPRAHFNLAICYFRQALSAKAAEHLRIVLDLEPRNAEAHNQLGIVLGEQGDLDGAVREFRAALAVRPNYTAARRNLEGALRLRSGTERN